MTPFLPPACWDMESVENSLSLHTLTTPQRRTPFLSVIFPYIKNNIFSFSFSGRASGVFILFWYSFVVDKIISNTRPKTARGRVYLLLTFRRCRDIINMLISDGEKPLYCLTVFVSCGSSYFFVLLFSALCNKAQKKGIRGITISPPGTLLPRAACAIWKK